MLPWHAVRAPQIAAVGNRDAQVAQGAPSSVERLHGCSRPVRDLGLPLPPTSLHESRPQRRLVRPRWARRWSPTKAGHVPNDVEVLSVSPLEAPTPVEWTLPASKSHAIRWLQMGTLGRSSVTLRGVAGLGEDARSMRRVLEQLGLKVEEDGDVWVLHPPASLRRPSALLHLGNSGTALRLVAALTSHLDQPAMLDGDASLRRRGLGDLGDVLVDQGVRLRAGDAHVRLPVDLRGPWGQGADPVIVRRDRSSQPASALLLASPLQTENCSVRFEGEARSSLHLALSANIAKACGWPGRLDDEGMHLPTWDVQAPNEVILPGDASMAAFALLWVRSTGATVHLKRWPRSEDALGCGLLAHLAPALGIAWSPEGELTSIEVGAEPLDVDLCDANDLLPPLAALLALGPGGRLHGAPHAAHKESNRIQSTVDVLRSFGLEVEPTAEGVHVQGGQRPSAPSGRIDAKDDHRLMMTATCLAGAVGGQVIGPRLHRVADPSFLERLEASGLVAQTRMVPP
ncbi:MAG: 3-phosphoshikimate 1-carboxyvinyltransferase [Candidatus Poseidoniaceae archaeon]